MPARDAAQNPFETHPIERRSFLGRGLALGMSLAAGASSMADAAAQGATAVRPEPSVRTDHGPDELNGQRMPEPPTERSAGPVRAGRGSMLTGKVALVTGAARGIGRAIAVEMAANGADVAALDIAAPVSSASDAKPATPDELEETVRQIKLFGRRALSMRADIRDIGALRGAADRVVSELGKIDIVVANAAIQRWKPLLEMQDADWKDTIENNLNGTANTIRAFAPKLVAQRRGRIIVLSSMQGKHGTKNAASYCASKWGILGLMKSAALELGEYNITVNAVIPGLVDTPLTRYEKRLENSIAETTGHPPQGTPTPQQAWETRAPTTAMKVGWLQPDDISPVAVFLASDAAALVTGAEYEVTAGDSAKNI
jgi:NAD(P)-dependent dehydrogenase (short-subunit alcohol dehydrogenase family)